MCFLSAEYLGNETWLSELHLLQAAGVAGGPQGVKQTKDTYAMYSSHHSATALNLSDELCNTATAVYWSGGVEKHAT